MTSEAATLSQLIETGITALACIGDMTTTDLHPTGLSRAEIYSSVASFADSVAKMHPWEEFLANLTFEGAEEAGVDFERAVLLLDLIELRTTQACQIISNLQSIN
jgi:hypothetical protein